jgi:cobalt-zinc-cadmium efflux system outer membrane protein
MTLADVLARAREQAPQIVGARLALEEARARLIGASVRLQSNPELDVSVGNRRGPIDRFTDVQVGVAQDFEPGARRNARMAGAEAAIAQSTANVDEVVRTVVHHAADAYYRVVYANDRLRLLNAAYELAASLYSSAERRYRAGDIAVLDVNIARASLARVGADREGAEAMKALALGDLRQLLGRDDVSVEGALVAPSPADVNALLQAATQRADLRGLEAAVREAEADVQFGVSLSQPQYGVGASYSREEGDQVVMGGLTITLPLFSKGQQQRAAGSARAARLRAELNSATARVQIEVRAAFEAYARRLAALRVLESEAIPWLDENEQLAARSYDVGQLGLPDVLLLRRETLETRFQYLDTLLEAALARLDLDASAGVLR